MREVESALADMLDSAMRSVAELVGEEFASQIEVVWNARMRSTAGRASWPSCKVELNPKLVELDLAEVRRTLLHELAHLVAYQRAGKLRIVPHGAEWQLACAQLGIPGERATHQLALPTRQQRRRWFYRCPVCSEGMARVRRMKGGVACYSCCRRHNGGRYHKDFQLVEERLDDV